MLRLAQENRERREEEEARKRQRAREGEAAAEETRRQLERIANRIAAPQAARDESARRARLQACTVCMEDNDSFDMVQAPCRHWYCRNCVLDGMEASFSSRSIFQCCQQNVPPALVADLLTANFHARYELLIAERTTHNTVYCANTKCGVFIHSANYHGPDLARCIQCGTETCRHCRTSNHADRVCTVDETTEQVRALAAETGWKPCPSCGTMVERTEGCLHVTCRCTAEFCYRCGGDWWKCQSACGNGRLYRV